MSGSSDDDDIIAGINVTPLVDIFLVLLIIFIATSAIIVRAAISVNLPNAATAGEALPDSVSIVIGCVSRRTEVGHVFCEEGQIAVNGEIVPQSLLQNILADEVERNPEARALIAADRVHDYGVVMDVIDEVRMAGFQAFSLNVERETEENR